MDTFFPKGFVFELDNLPCEYESLLPSSYRLSRMTRWPTFMFHGVTKLTNIAGNIGVRPKINSSYISAFRLEIFVVILLFFFLQFACVSSSLSAFTIDSCLDESFIAGFWNPVGIRFSDDRYFGIAVRNSFPTFLCSRTFRVRKCVSGRFFCGGESKATWTKPHRSCSFLEQTVPTDLGKRLCLSRRVSSFLRGHEFSEQMHYDVLEEFASLHRYDLIESREFKTERFWDDIQIQIGIMRREFKRSLTIIYFPHRWYSSLFRDEQSLLRVQQSRLSRDWNA